MTNQTLSIIINEAHKVFVSIFKNNYLKRFTGKREYANRAYN